MAVAQKTDQKTITLTINGQEVEAQAGQTVLEVARSIGVDIPTLCYDQRLEPYGACRLCVVEVDGFRGPVPSCALKAADGMVVRTHTEKIRKLRKFVMELLLSNHPLDCPVCEAAGDCRLQDYAYELEVDSLPYGWHPLEFDTRDDHPNIARNPNRCILCGRCVRICRDVVGIGCWGFRNRGYDTIIDTPYNMPLEEVGCISCGQCISTCPVGALSMKRSRYAARHWQTEKVVNTCPQCPTGCTLIMNTYRGKLVRVTSRVGLGGNNGNLCVRGRFNLDYVNSISRLTAPLVKDTSGELKAVPMTEALEVATTRLRAIKANKGGRAFGVIASSLGTNEESYLVQKFARAVLGTNNVAQAGDASETATVEGLGRTLGSPAMTNSIRDIAEADVIFLIGANPFKTHQVLGFALVRALKAGKQLIVADPEDTKLAKKAAIHLKLQPGTDDALLFGMLRHIVDSGLMDDGFVATHVTDLQGLTASLRLKTVEEAAAACGVPAEEIRRAAELYAKAAKANILYAKGLSAGPKAQDNIAALADLALLTGNVGRPGTGVNALRDKTNSQGASDMGLLPAYFPGYRRVDDPDAIRSMESAWQTKLEDTSPGKSAEDILRAAAAGEIEALFLVGVDPATTSLDYPLLKEALDKVPFLMVLDATLTEAGQEADVVLPARLVTERQGTLTSTERRIQLVRQALEAPDTVPPDWRTLQMLANQLGATWGYTSPEQIMSEISGVVPAYEGVRYSVLETKGVQWPWAVGDDAGAPVLFSGNDHKFVLAPALFAAS